MGDLLHSTDAEIEQHVQSGDPMTLRGLLYQLTGDPAIAATTLGEAPGMVAPVKSLVDPQDIELVRTAAAAYLRAHRDAGRAGRRARSRPSGCRRASAWPWARTSRRRRSSSASRSSAIERIPRRHELAAPAARHGTFHVVVIGSGVGGINAAINLKECGIPFTVLDKNDDVGGTWHDNRYPGCRVDVPSLAYSHSFGLHYPWDHWFAPQEREQRATCSGASTRSACATTSGSPPR